MRKFVSLLSITLLFLSGPVRAENCLTLARRVILPPYKGAFKDIPENELHEKIRHLEYVINFFRKSKDGESPAVIDRVSERISKMDSSFMNGEDERVYREMRTLFRKYEMAVLYARDFQKAREALESVSKNSSEAKIKKSLSDAGLRQGVVEMIMEVHNPKRGVGYLQKQVNKRIKESLVTVGTFYQDYMMIRRHFEGLLEGQNCDSKCQNRVKDLFSRVGVSARQEQQHFPRFLKGQERPSLELISDLLHKNPLATLSHLRRERDAELLSSFGKFFLEKTMIKGFYEFYRDLTTKLETRLVRLVKGIYDSNARITHFPQINQLVRSAKSIDQKFGDFLSILKEFGNNELLITFSRREDLGASELWSEFKKLAKKHDQELYQRLLQAERRGEARGPISLRPKDSYVGKIATLVALGSSGVIVYNYYQFDSEPRSVPVSGTGGSSSEPVSQSDNSSDDVDIRQLGNGDTVTRRQVEMNLRDEDSEEMFRLMFEFYKQNEEHFQSGDVKDFNFEDLQIPSRGPAQLRPSDNQVYLPWLRNFFLKMGFTIRSYYKDWTCPLD